MDQIYFIFKTIDGSSYIHSYTPHPYILSLVDLLKFGFFQEQINYLLWLISLSQRINSYAY